MFIKKDKYHRERKWVKDQLRIWRNETFPSDYFFNMLDSHIRYNGVIMTDSKISFSVVDRMVRHNFYVSFDLKTKNFSLLIPKDKERFEFLIDPEKKAVSIKPSRELRKLLNNIHELYKKTYPVLTPLPSTSISPGSKKVDPVKLKSLQHYKETWEGYISPNKFPKPTSIFGLKRVLAQKKQVVHELMNLLKHPIPHCEIRAINTFLWNIDLHAEFFEKPFQDVLKRENFETIHLQVRFPLLYPKQFPFIRVMEPRLIHDKVSIGGVLQEEFTFRNFRELLKNLKETMKFFKIDLSVKPHQHEYDQELSKTDWKRIEIYNTSSEFPTINRFDERFHAVPPIFHFYTNKEAESMEYGNKIMLPMAALNLIFKNTNQHPTYPLLFEVKSKQGKLFAGAGEFTAKHEQAVIPSWMLRALKIPNGGGVRCRCVALPMCSHVKFMSHDPTFLRKVKNYKLLLESCLGNFHTLTIGDSIPLQFGSSVFWMCIVDLKPANAVSIRRGQFGVIEFSFEVVPPSDESSKSEFTNDLRKGGIPISSISEEDEEDISGETPQSAIPKPNRTVDDIIDPIKSPKKKPGLDYVKCENCGHSVDEWSYRRHLPHCRKTYFRCTKCEKVIKLVEKEAHEKEFHTVLKCKKCGAELEKTGMYDHLRKNCPHRMVHCQYFGCPVQANLLEEHEEECGVKTEKCLKCGKNIYMKAKLGHKIEGCQFGGDTNDPRFNIRKIISEVDRKKLINPSKNLGEMSDYEWQLSKALELSYGFEDKKKTVSPKDDGLEEEKIYPEESPFTSSEEDMPYSPPIKIDGIDYELARALELSRLDLIKKEKDKDESEGEVQKENEEISKHFPEISEVEKPVPTLTKEDEDLAKAIQLSIMMDGKKNTTGITCPFCNIGVGNEGEFFDHVLSNHAMNSKRVKCPICNTFEEPFYNHMCRVHIK